MLLISIYFYLHLPRCRIHHGSHHSYSVYGLCHTLWILQYHNPVLKIQVSNDCIFCCIKISYSIFQFYTVNAIINAFFFTIIGKHRRAVFQVIGIKPAGKAKTCTVQPVLLIATLAASCAERFIKEVAENSSKSSWRIKYFCKDKWDYTFVASMHNYHRSQAD